MSKDIQRALNIQLGLASDDETLELGGDVEAVAETAAVAEGAVEVADATDEVVEADQTVDELSEAHENLEEVSEALEEAAANGGISQESARFAHLAIKAACGRFYSPAIASALPSVESFTGSSSRQRNTTIALESVGTMLRSFWDAIVRQIKKLWATVKNWYLKVLDAAPRLKKKAESLAKAAGDITGAPGEKNIDIGVLRQLHLNGRAPDAAAFITSLGIISKQAEVSLGAKLSGSYEKLFEDFETCVDEVTGVDGAAFGATGAPTALAGTGGLYSSTTAAFADIKKHVDALNAQVTAATTAMSTGGTAVTGPRLPANTTMKHSAEMPGGKAVFVSVSTLTPAADDYTVARVARSMGSKIGDFLEKPKDVDSSGNFKTLTSAQIQTICDAISDMCDEIIAYKKSWESRSKHFAKIETSGKKAVANMEKDKDAKPLQVRATKDILMGSSSLLQNSVRFESQLINYIMAVSRSAIVWVERSLSQYK